MLFKRCEQATKRCLPSFENSVDGNPEESEDEVWALCGLEVTSSA